MTIRQSHVTVNVKDMDTSISFYQSIGLIVKNRWGNYYAQLTAPGIDIGSLTALYFIKPKWG